MPPRSGEAPGLHVGDFVALGSLPPRLGLVVQLRESRCREASVVMVLWEDGCTEGWSRTYLEDFRVEDLP